MNSTERFEIQELVTITDRMMDPASRRPPLRMARLVRYYTTLGLLDRPAEVRRQTAYYAPRHVLQLLAIKRLQAQGCTLELVQLRLVGLPNPTLARVCGLNEDWPQTHTPASQDRFWERPPPSLPERTPDFQVWELAPGIRFRVEARKFPNLNPEEIRNALPIKNTKEKTP